MRVRRRVFFFGNIDTVSWDRLQIRNIEAESHNPTDFASEHDRAVRRVDS